MILMNKSYRYKISFWDHFQNTIATNYIKKKNIQYSGERNHRIAVFANDWIGAMIYLDGVYERQEISELIDIINSLDIDMANSTAIDVGANIGNHAIAFSKYFQQVEAFEPNPSSYKLLEFNSSGIPNIRIHKSGLSKQSEVLELSVDPANYGGSSAIYDRGHQLNVEIQLKPLDDFINNLTNVKLLKIDVEGMELQVIEGSRCLINTHNPIIAFEQHESDFISGENNTPATKLLSELGYTIYWIEFANFRKPWISRKLINIYEIFAGKTFIRKLTTDDNIPRQHHSMLIAVPKDINKLQVSDKRS